jgi:hypothetical protein
MDDAKEYLWRMYSENMTHVRHVETQRSTITSVLLTLAGAVLGVVAFQWKETETTNPALSLLLMLIGFTGIVFTAKLYELYKEHTERARAYRKELSSRIPEATLEELKQQADDRWRKKAPWLLKLPVHVLWLGPHFFTAMLGVVILMASLFA